jgi:plastocyanin
VRTTPPSWSILIVVAVAAVVVLGFCSYRAGAPGVPEQGEPSRHVRIAMRNYVFDPPEITIPVGTTVDWIDNEGKHGVQFDDSGPAMDRDDGLEVGGSVSRTFQTPGRYPYHCPVHGGPGGQGMAGTVIVVQ